MDVAPDRRPRRATSPRWAVGARSAGRAGGTSAARRSALTSPDATTTRTWRAQPGRSPPCWSRSGVRRAAPSNPQRGTRLTEYPAGQVLSDEVRDGADFEQTRSPSRRAATTIAHRGVARGVPEDVEAVLDAATDSGARGHRAGARTHDTARRYARATARTRRRSGWSFGCRRSSRRSAPTVPAVRRHATAVPAAGGRGPAGRGRPAPDTAGVSRRWCGRPSPLSECTSPRAARARPICVGGHEPISVSGRCNLAQLPTQATLLPRTSRGRTRP